VERQIFALLLQAAVDGNPMVRREVVNVIGGAIFASYFPQAIEAVSRVVGEEIRDHAQPPQPQQQQQRRSGSMMRPNQQQQPSLQSNNSSGASNSLNEMGESFELPMDLLVRLYKTLLNLSMDGHPDVAQPAREACDVLMQCYAHSRTFFGMESALDQSLHRMEITRAANGQRPIMSFIRRSGSIGDALLGQPPAGSQGDATASSSYQGRTIDPRRAPAIGAARGGGPQQGQGEHQLKQQQQQRRLSGYSGQRSSGSGQPSLSEQRGRDIGRQNSVPAHHRYTMHLVQSDSPQGLFGNSDRGQRQLATQSPSSATASGNLATFNNVAGSPPPPPPPQQQKQQRAQMVRSPTQSKDRFSGVEDADRRIAAIENAWMEWGRRELRDTVCVSTLIDWAGAHFTEFDIALFASFSGPMQGSAALVESRERSRRIERLEAGARAMGGSVGHMKWLDVTAVAGGAAAASTAIMHPVEPHAIVGSQRGTVSVYDWEMQAQVGQYAIATSRSGAGAAPEAISSMHLINPLGQARLLVATRGGGVRIFASHAPDFHPPPPGSSRQPPAFPRPRLLTAFTAVPWTASAAAAAVAAGASPTAAAAAATPSASAAGAARGVGGMPLNRSLTTVEGNPRMRALHQSQLQAERSDIMAGMSAAITGSKTRYGVEGPGNSSGLVTAWNQRNALLYAGGNDKEVRVWDINAEMCIEEIPVASIGGINCISQDG
ncbi:hypothetical protein GGI23_006239, partial [Coemansia sp. RSA 2559]